MEGGAGNKDEKRGGREEVKAAFERLRASVRTGAKGSDGIRLFQVIDVLEQNAMAGRLTAVENAKSEIQVVKGTTRRLLRDTPDGMVRLLKAIDGLEDELVKFLDALAKQQP